METAARSMRLFLRVVLLAIDLPRQPVLLPIDPGLLPRREVSAVVLAHVAHLVVQPRLPALESRRLAGGELAALHPLSDPVLLVFGAPLDPPGRLRGRREQQECR